MERASTSIVTAPIGSVAHSADTARPASPRTCLQSHESRNTRGSEALVAATGTVYPRQYSQASAAISGEARSRTTGKTSYSPAGRGPATAAPSTQCASAGATAPVSAGPDNDVIVRKVAEAKSKCAPPQPTTRPSLT